MLIVDIYSTSDDPVAAGLSNFRPYAFELDEVRCASMEGWLQSLKVLRRGTQLQLAQQVGYQAYKEGQLYNQLWQLNQLLHWRGYSMERRSEEYQQLLTRAYDAWYDQNPNVAKLLLRTVGKQLRHTRGKHDSTRTVLTESEYIQQLERLRWRALLAVARKD